MFADPACNKRIADAVAVGPLAAAGADVAVGYVGNVEAAAETAERLGAEILSLCVAAGGTVTGEHGVGVEKIDSMCEQFTEEELAQFHALKAAFDPRGLLNPGKAVPTLHRCAELGAMHVHGGKLPFPDLPRF